MSEDEYRIIVLDEFDRRQKEGSLPFNLTSPTRRSLKDQCIKVCSESYFAKDEPLLSSFFGAKEDRAAYVKAIQNKEAETFRTLHNFLNDRAIKTSFENICMLAFLLNFEPRPYHINLTLTHKQQLKLPETIVRDDNKNGEKQGSPRDVSKPVLPPYKRLTIALTLMLVALIGAYLIYRVPPGLKGDEDCMIWADDHFQPVYCKGQSNAVLTWPVDHQLLKDFRLITQPDTLTHYSVRKVYYASFKGRHEFFTTNGPFPLDTNRRLLPMTPHILEKYILHIKN